MEQDILELQRKSLELAPEIEPAPITKEIDDIVEGLRMEFSG